MTLNNTMKITIGAILSVIIGFVVYYYLNNSEDCILYTKLDVSNIFPP